MPAPTNLSAATATPLGTLPAAVTQDVHDSGTTYTVYFSFTPPTTGLVHVWGHGASLTPGTYRPTVRVYTDAGGALGDFLVGDQDRPLQIRVTAGAGYFIECVRSSSTVTPAVLTLDVRHQADGAWVAGDLLVPDDADGFPAIVLDQATGAVVAALDTVAGEWGDVDPVTGRFLLEDSTAGTVVLYAADGSVLTTVAGLPIDFQNNIRWATTAERFVVGQPGDASTVGTLASVDIDGVVDTIWTLPDNAFRSIAPAHDLSVIYVAGFQGTHSIKRWLTASSTWGTDLAAAVATYDVPDLLVLADDTIVALYRKLSGTPRHVFARHYAAAGTVLQTYDFDTDNESTIPKLAQALDTPTTFWVWLHKAATGASRSAFLEVDVATGASVTALTDLPVYEGGSYQGPLALTIDAADRLGHSFSCPFLVLRVVAAPTTGTIVVAKAALDDSDEVSDPPVFTFTMSPAESFDPATFTLSPGESMTFTDVEPGSGYGVSEAALAGWDLDSTVVSNSSPSVNLTVDAGETVTVTFTNVPDVCECCVSTKLEVVNFALAKLGHTRFITDLDEATAEGYTANQLWDLALRAALRHFPWPFATKYAGGDPSDVVDGYMNLIDGSASDPAVADEWTYAYRYPIDCLKARRIVKEGGVGRGFDPAPIPFRVGRTWNGSNDVPLIYCNIEDAVLEYTALVECSEEFFDALFEDALSWRLAGLLAPGLTRTAKTATECYQMFALLLDQAAAVASQEAQQEPHGEASWTRDRE